jgi:glycosyltransferase involved in cell wall biosynthesis
MAVGGVQRVLLETLSRADRGRFDHAVLCTKKEGKWARDVRALDIPLTLQKTLPPWSPLQILRLARAIRRINPDLIHIHMAPLVIPAASAARLAGVGRCIIEHHNFYDRHWSALNPLLFRWERWLTRRADALISVSHSVAECSSRHLGLPAGKFTTVYNGIQTERFTHAEPRDPRPEWGLAPGTPLVVHVARYLNTKRIEDFIEAGALIVRRWNGQAPRPVFVVIGGGAQDYHERYKQWIRKLGVRGSVILAGSREDVPAILPTAQVGVLASEMEGFGLVVLEYLAAGLPVVATDLGPIAELVRDGEEALLVPTRRPDRLADNIERLLLDRALAERLVENGRRRLDLFNWDATARGYERVYDRLLER